MGSFNGTCIISGLPIESGTPVRFVTLTKHPHRMDNEYACYVTGRWQLRCPPVHARYNDYGSVKDVQVGLTSRVFFGSLARDCVERGTGDNQYHDHEVRADMSLAAWLEALRGGRVFVADRDPFPMQKDWTPPEPAEGMPSMRRIEAVIAASGGTGYVVDEAARGFVRVRHGRHEQGTAALDRVVPLLHAAGYAAMVTCGTGTYSDHAEILVAPRPAPKGARFHTDGLFTRDRKEAPRPVAQAMIREDVWQILLKTSGWGTFEAMLTDARELLKAELDWKAEEAAFESRDPATVPEEEAHAHSRKAIRREFSEDRRNLLCQALHEGEGVSGFSLKESFKLALALGSSPEELDAFVVDLAETAWVQGAYADLHGQWHLSTNNGQDPGWKEHRKFLTALLGIKGCWEEEEELDEEEDANEDDADDADDGAGDASEGADG